jgi:hypothetical protein
MEKDFKKYRWFFTSGGNLVIGGKSSEQNEEIMKSINASDIVMHTSSPGSPFCIIKNPGKNDIEECAIFNACFSQEWKRGKKKSEVHIFSGKQVVKSKGMKEGTFGISGVVKKKQVQLKLNLCFQEKILRAVPKETAGKEGMLILTPGKIEKDKAAEKIVSMFKEKFNIVVSKEDILSAIPSGGFEINE